MRATVFRRLALLLGAALVGLLLVWAVSLSRPWHALEFKTFDLWTSLAAPRSSTLPVVVLAIDEPTYQQLGKRWPFPRSLHARLLDRLREDGAAAVGFDVVFADPSAPEQDAAFAHSLAAAAAAGLPVVLAATREKIESASATLWTDVLPLPAFVAAGAQYGNAGVQPDDDFVVRRMPQSEGSFSAALARAATRHAVPASSADLIAYRGPRGTFDTRSYYQALEPGLLPEGFFRGKVVLIGRSALTASELQHSQADLFNSPFAALGGERLFPGVELQATLLDNRAVGDGLRLVPEAWSLALVLLALTVLLPATLRWHPGAVALLTAGLVGGMALLSWLLFLQFGRWLAPLFPMAATASIYGASALMAYAQTRQRARQTRAMFSQYVPAAVVSRLVAEPELLRLGGEAREVTLLFTDLAGFTTLSEQLSAEQTVELLGLYFGAMAPIVHASGGTIDKYIGDALMAFWGAPLDDVDHAEHAVRAAVAMQEAMGNLCDALERRGLPRIAMRIGVHSGRVVVGNVGSAERFSYTAIGDAVNLAARLEGANKAFGTDILISGATAALLPASMGLRALDDVVVKGKSAPVRVYTPCADPAVCRLARAALDAFVLGDWQAARSGFAQQLRASPGDPALQRLMERLDAACALPPGAPWSAAQALDKL
jgi:adenylate cyclase